jgi:phosphohistidine phosphatase
MEIYLIRHGIAAERGIYQTDEVRPLIPEGREKTTKIAKNLAKIPVSFDLILTSPLVRAKETAEILLKEGLSDRLEEYSPLAPGGNINTWIKWYQKHEPETLALVGHQPDLGNWTEILVWGEIREQLIVKKAGIIGLRVLSTLEVIGNCQLFLLTAPKWFI